MRVFLSIILYILIFPVALVMGTITFYHELHRKVWNDTETSVSQN